MKLTYYIFFTAVFLYSLQAQQTEHVVVVVIDGARYTETFGDVSHTYIPNIWNQLRPLGTMYTSIWNEGVTVTNPGHASILTGTWQDLANDGSERPTSPTIFEYFRKQKGEDSLSCWVALGKSKLDILTGSTHPEYGKDYFASLRPSADVYNDVVAWENARYVLQTYHPRLTAINFPQTDYRGHAGIWEEYLAAIQSVDSLTGLLWNVIQEDTLLCDKTTMIITNDHGRHTSDFTSHGDGCEGCRHIMVLCLGPDTPSDVIDSLTHVQVDIAPTIGSLMGFSTPYSIGTVLSSAVGVTIPIHIPIVPLDFILHQNYPNPFNPLTMIRYSVPGVGTRYAVSLRIFDLLGREVAVLVQEEKPAGNYEVKWDASHVTSGVYFYTLQVGGLRESKKMVLLK